MINRILLLSPLLDFYLVENRDQIFFIFLTSVTLRDGTRLMSLNWIQWIRSLQVWWRALASTGLQTQFSSHSWVQALICYNMGCFLMVSHLGDAVLVLCQICFYSWRSWWFLLWILTSSLYVHWLVLCSLYHKSKWEEGFQNMSLNICFFKKLNFSFFSFTAESQSKMRGGGI